MYLLWQISRLDLQLTPTHPDLAGGLGGFGVAHVALGPLSCALTAMLAASYAERIMHGGARVEEFVMPLAEVIVGNTLAIVGPLFLFAPQLVQVKQQGVIDYGALATRYVREFDAKWVRSSTLPADPLLGSADVQSLADLANSFDVVRSMRMVPIALSQITLLLAIAALPVAPLVLFVVPLDQLVIREAKALLGL